MLTRFELNKEISAVYSAPSLEEAIKKYAAASLMIQFEAAECLARIADYQEIISDKILEITLEAERKRAAGQSG